MKADRETMRMSASTTVLDRLRHLRARLARLLPGSTTIIELDYAIAQLEQEAR